MKEPAYPAARVVAAKVHSHFAQDLATAGRSGPQTTASLPDPGTMEAVIDAAFWASLRREEGYSPQISLAFLEPQGADGALLFERPLPLTPVSLVSLAPAVERPGIHLGVWRENGEMCVWGATRKIPPLCFVLEVIAPGLLVIKHRRAEEASKFVNIAVLEGDQVKVLDPEAAKLPGCPNLVMGLLGFDPLGTQPESVSLLVQLAVSMRAHRRGGTLLVVPAGTRVWRESIVEPVRYSVLPPFDRMAALVRERPGRRDDGVWQERVRPVIDFIAGLTAVDGATVISHNYGLHAFGAKIRRREGWPMVEQVILTEPIEGAAVERMAPGQVGGTRHSSAAQFAHDQRDSIALVASQDGRFTAFAWSDCEQAVHAHRLEALLL